MADIHIVTHCYAVELPQFATFLRHQLTSLVWHPPSVDFLIEVRYCDNDEATVEVADSFSVLLGAHIGLSPMSPPGRLWRRAIGRNEAALSSHADLVWFTDCDYLFGPGCLDGLWNEWNKLTDFVSMIYPRQIMTMRSQQLGDELLTWAVHVDPTSLPDVFVPQVVKKAFGGLQIVPGSLASKHGYLDGHRRYQQPHHRPFANFHDDVVYRKAMLKIGPIVPVDVPNLYRLRHTKTTYQGQDHGKAAG